MSQPQPSTLPAPPGYHALVPFDRERFRGMGRRRDGHAAFVSDHNALPVAAAEFFPAARHYPIAFSRDGASGLLTPVIVTGLDARENLFVTADGAWSPHDYVPAWVRRWPFFSLPFERDASRVLVCVDPSGLADDTAPFIDAHGEPTPAWTAMERLINDMETARRHTLAMMRCLVEFDLTEPFEAHAVERQGESLRMTNLYRVAEARLERLPARQLRRLMTQGFLSRIYAHLMSLDNFQRLLDRRTTRRQGG